MRRCHLIDAGAHFAGGAGRIVQRTSADLSCEAGPVGHLAAVGHLAGACCEKLQK